ncbi:DNA-binding transcriptional LysR family regulator [Paraburkholderia sp. GAS448]|uniref:LysR family transcriptional regulator n=1 Tax=Paraburkholderia sp. GAS448 TaxID=3035136 RepID=UPI003D1AC381
MPAISCQLSGKTRYAAAVRLSVHCKRSGGARNDELLHQLTAFEAVARHLSYVTAAEELHVTPALIGQLIRGLEDALDVELFHRAPSGPSRLVLTDAARSIMPELQAGFDLLSTVVERLKASKARQERKTTRSF